MKLTTWNPTAMAFRTDADRLFENFWNTRAEARNSTWVPATDLLEDAESYHILIDLPGFSEKDLEIEIKDGELTISGEKRRPDLGEEVTCHQQERRYGTFRKAFRMGDGLDLEKIRASFRNGVLELTLPKSAAVKPKTITITRD